MKTKKDRTTYKVEEFTCITKSAVAHVVLATIIKKYSWQQLNEMFEKAKAYNESMKLLLPVKQAKIRSERYTRYLLHDEDILTDKYGVKVAVSNSFSIWNINAFIQYSKRQFKLNIKPIK